MVRKHHTGQFLLSLAAVLNAGTMLLNDGTRAHVAIVDTSGGFVTVRYNGRDVRIDKKQVQTFDIGADSPNSGADTSRDRKSAAYVSVNDALAGVLAGYAVQKMPIARDAAIALLKQPVAATSGVDRKTIDAFSGAMARFLARHGAVSAVSMEGAFFRLLHDTVSVNDCRYLALPAEISLRSNNRKMNVSSFATLDKEGNFVPTNAGTTLQARETETTVRFVIVDLSDSTIVFDERVKDSDPGLQSLAPGNPKDIQRAPVNNSILTIENKMETLLKKRFK